VSNIITLMPRLIIVIAGIFFIIFIGRKLINNMIKDYRSNNYGRILSVIVVVMACVFLFQYEINGFNKNRLSIGNKVAKEDIIKLNQTKESNTGTKVTINDVLLDINTINFNLGVKGKDKVVAVEIKKSPEYTETLGEITGLYIGKKTMYEYNGLGLSLEVDEFIETLYIICYLNSGEELSFRVEDVNNVKNRVKIVEINKKFKDNPQVILNKVTKGISHTSINVSSDVNFFDLEVTILDGAEEYTQLPGYGSGGLFGYSGPPVKTKDVKIKVKIKSSGEEIIIPVEL
jgi:hypothetical protein